MFLNLRHSSEKNREKTKGTGHNKFVRRVPTLSGAGVIEDTTYLVNITDKILLALKFDLTQKYSASKSQHC